MDTIVLIPAFDEKPTLDDIVRRAAVYSRIQIVVDDGSTDGSGDLLGALARDLPGLKVIRHASNLGMAAALKSGFKQVVDLLEEGAVNANDALILMDADGQHLPEEISLMAHALEDRNADLVIGRRDFSVYPFYKRFGNRLLSLWGGLLAGMRFQDIECGFKALRAGAVPRVLAYYAGYRYSCAQEIALICARQGLKVANDCMVKVPVYRRGARMRDFFPNLFFGFCTFLRLCMKWERKG